MDIQQFYTVLELTPEWEYSKQQLKKQFYKLSSRYHPDRFQKRDYTLEIKNKYIRIIEAYNYLKSLEKEDITSDLPHDHSALKFINKINMENKKTKAIPEDFNEVFLESISGEDTINLKLFFELGLSEQDIDVQFVLLHPNSQTIVDNKVYLNNDLKLKDYIKQRELEIQDSLPKNILSSEKLNSQFKKNREQGMSVVRYSEPDNDKFYMMGGIDNTYRVDDELFRKEYDLPKNPDTLFDIDKNMNCRDDKLDIDMFNKKLDELISERDNLVIL